MAIFADVQCCIYAVIVGGSKKVQNYADILYGWSPRENLLQKFFQGLFFKLPLNPYKISNKFRDFMISIWNKLLAY